jgi:hypothetical protein
MILKKIKIIYKNIQDQENDGGWNWKKKEKKKDHHLY